MNVTLKADPEQSRVVGCCMELWRVVDGAVLPARLCCTIPAPQTPEGQLAAGLAISTPQLLTGGWVVTTMGTGHAAFCMPETPGGT